MRIVVLFLIAANLLLFGVWHGGWVDWPGEEREPWRLAQQVAPQNIRLLPSNANPGEPGKNASCVEFGGFAGEDLRRAETMLAELKLGPRLSQRQVQEILGYMVYLPPFRTRTEADRALAGLRDSGVRDFFLIQDNTPQRLAISLGVYKTAEGAKTRSQALAQLGVKNVQIAARNSANMRTWFQVRDPSDEDKTALEALGKRFENQDLTLATCQ